MKTRTFIVFCSLAALALAACSSDDSTDTTIPATDASDLVGTEWIVQAFSIGGVDVAIVPDADPTIEFSADRAEIFGTTGCNSYFGAIDYGPAGEVTVGGIGQTEMACFPDEVMAQEQQFTQALSAVRVYEISDDRLTLADDDGSVVITAINRDSVETPVGLGDGSWVADTRIEGEAASTLVPDTQVTVTFDVAAGTLRGSSGCNDYGASFVVDNDRIRIDTLEATEIGCDAPIMEQEAFVYGVLTDADTFEIDRNRLTIVTADGRGLGFRPDGSS